MIQIKETSQNPAEDITNILIGLTYGEAISVLNDVKDRLTNQLILTKDS